MEKIRFGVIGLGNQGTYYICSIFDKDLIENGVLTAVCDNNPTKIENIKSKSVKAGELAYFDNYIEMLDSGLCDAILVETPHYSHPEIVMECLKRDINVICEKPAGVYTKQVREMNEAAKNSKARFGMMFNQRTDSLYRKMREIIQSGGIGELQRVSWTITTWFRTQRYYDTGSWRATWEGEGGGVLINQCPHQIDLVSWIIGEQPASVNAFCKYGQWHDIEVEDEVTAYFEYKNGATGTFVTTTGETPGSNRFEVSGTKGKLLCDNGKLIWWKGEKDTREYIYNSEQVWVIPQFEVVEVETDGKSEQHAGIIRNFANALCGLEDFFVDGVEGINGVDLMNAIELSGWKNGAKVTLPVDEEEYLAELNKHRATSRLKNVNDNQVTDTNGTFGTK